MDMARGLVHRLARHGDWDRGRRALNLILLWGIGRRLLALAAVQVH